jgi:phosphoglycerate dehydrogenase-like enzyme
MNVLLIGKPSVPYADTLANLINTDWNIKCIEDNSVNDEVSDVFGTADAIISLTYDSSFPNAPNLKLLQVPGAGLDKILPEAVPSNAAICNAFGHQIPIAEYCIMGMLVCAHQLIDIDEKFRNGDWLWSDAKRFPTHNEIYGKSVCIVGLGRIGLEISKRASALGMHVIGCSRSAKKHIQDVDEAGTYDELELFIPRADFVVLCCPLSDQTRNIIDRRLLEMMKSTAVLINTGRGLLVSERDLYFALKEKTISAAVLDVWFQYPDTTNNQPRPSQYSFHNLKNVLMTPHLSGWTEEMVDRRWTEIATNIDNIFLNAPLINVIRKPR